MYGGIREWVVSQRDGNWERRRGGAARSGEGRCTCYIYRVGGHCRELHWRRAGRVITGGRLSHTWALGGSLRGAACPTL